MVHTQSDTSGAINGIEIMFLYLLEVLLTSVLKKETTGVDQDPNLWEVTK